MKKCWFYLLVFLFIAGVVVRIAHFPFRESAVLRAIPPEFVVMTRHIEPGTRWAQALEEGVLDPWLRLAGIESEDPGKDLMEDPGFAWLLSTLGRRYVATAYVERFGGQLIPAWIASAWVGGRFTHLARMGFLDDAFPDFRVVDMDNGNRIWSGYFPDYPQGYQYLSFAIYEGVAFGVATDLPLGVARLYPVMRRQARSGAQAYLTEVPASLSDVPDLFRVNMPNDLVLMGGLSRLSSDALRMDISFEASEGVNMQGKVPTTLSDVLSMVKPTAAAVVGTTSGNAIRIMDTYAQPRLTRDIVQLVYTHATGRRDDVALVGWIANRQHGGRLMRLRVPAAGIALEVLPNLSIEDLAATVLQRLETQYGMSWETVPYGERGVLSLTPSGGNWYGQLPRGERVGLAIWNGFLMVHSSASALDALIEHFRRNAALDPHPVPESASWYLRLDGSAVAEIMQLGVSSYALWQVMDGQRRDRARETWLHLLADSIASYSHGEGLVLEQGKWSMGSLELVPEQKKP